MLFHLISRPTLTFRAVEVYKAAGHIPSVKGVTLDGKRQTFARIEDVVILPDTFLEVLPH